MAYLDSDDRTTVLLEAIEDAEKQLEQDDDGVAVPLLRHIIATAKRHYGWPETERKRLAEYESKTPAPEEVEAYPVPQRASTLKEPAEF